MKKHLRELQTAMTKIGCRDIRIEQGAKHHKVYYTFGRNPAVERFITVSSSPRDADHLVDRSLQIVRRTIAAAAAEPIVENIKGALRRPAVKAERSYYIKPQIQPPLPEPTAAVRQDRFGGLLAQHPAWLGAQADRAWLNLWRACMAAAGAVSRI